MSQVVETPDLSSYDPNPTIAGISGADKWFQEQRVPVPYNTIVEAVYYKRTLPRFKLGRKIFFSERDLMRWVFKQRGLAVRRVPND